LIFSSVVAATTHAQKTWTHSASSSSTFKIYNSSDFESYKFVGTATYFGADFTFNKTGGVITKVYETSPASDFNFKADDIVTGMGNFKILSAEDYEKAIQFYKPNDEVPVSYIRDGEERSRIVVLDKIDVFKSEKSGKKLEIPSQHLSGSKETIKVLETGKH
jgi:predicted metalloprotease with PDZ domain